MDRRNAMTVYLPEEHWFRVDVADGAMRVERVTFGRYDVDPADSPSERKVDVSGRVILAGTHKAGMNQRTGTIRASQIPAAVATYILGTLM